MRKGLTVHFVDMSAPGALLATVCPVWGWAEGLCTGHWLHGAGPRTAYAPVSRRLQGS